MAVLTVCTALEQFKKLKGYGMKLSVCLIIVSCQTTILLSLNQLCYGYRCYTDRILNNVFNLVKYFFCNQVQWENMKFSTI